GLLADAIRKGSRQLAVHQDSRRVVVEGGGIDRDLPPGAARDRHAQLEREVQLRFGDAGGLPQSAEDLRCIFGSLEAQLSPAIVAAAGALHDEGDRQLPGQGLQPVRVFDLAHEAQRKAVRVQPTLLPGAVLHHLDDVATGPDGDALRCRVQALGRDLLDLEGEHVALEGELARPGRILELGAQAALDDRPGGAVGIRVEHGDAVAQVTRGQGHHAAELTAAEDAEGGAGEDGHVGRPRCGVVAAPAAMGPAALQSSRWESTSSRRASRQAWRRSRSAASWRARMLAAWKAALMAPAFPMAWVPTGVPFGIWTIDISASTPARMVVGTGTPRTGRRVLLATIPGRCAAPPAPAMRTRSPRPAASVA